MKKSFTLIELLVVIAIISILMTMLLPAAGKVRETARSIKCTSNMKQVSVALNSYAADYDGLIPKSWSAPYSWNLLVYPYINSAITPDINPLKLDSTGIYCPSADKANYMFTTYAMNSYAGGYKWYPNGATYDTQCNIYKVKSPSLTFLVGEKEPGATGGCYAIFYSDIKLVPSTDLNYKVSIYRHNNGSNWAFFDGHVEYAKGLESVAWSNPKKGYGLENAY